VGRGPKKEWEPLLYVLMNRTGRRQKIIVDNKQIVCHVYIFFAHVVTSILVHDNCIWCSKKFRAIIGRNFISVHDTGPVKHRVYNKMCAPEQERRVKCVYTNLHTRPLWSKVPENTEKYIVAILLFQKHFHNFQSTRTYKNTSYCLYLDTHVCIHLGRRDLSVLTRH